MFKIVDTLIKRYFSNEEVVVFLLLLIATLGVLALWGGVLAPVLIAIVLAFLLQGVVDRLQKVGLGHVTSVFLVFFTFLTSCGVFIAVMVPIIWRQAVRFVQDAPRMFTVIRDEILHFAEGNSEFVSQTAIDEIVNTLANESTNLGQWLVSFSLSSIPSLFSLVIYLVLVPLVMFFLLKDQDKILSYLTSWLPKERKMMRNIAHEMNEQIANYIRGKFIEMLVVSQNKYLAVLVFNAVYNY